MFFSLFILIIVVAAMVVFPFIKPILTSFVLAYIFFPVYKWLAKKTKRKNLSAFIVSLLLILLVLIPLSFTLYQISKEANVGYVILKQKYYGSDSFEGLKRFTNRPEIRSYVENSFAKISSTLTDNTFNFVFSVPSRMLDIILTFFFTFFLLRDGKSIVQKIQKSMPMKSSQKAEITKHINGVVYAIINGFFLIAIIEGIIGAIAFKLFGVASPLMWGVVIAVLTFVPFIGAAVIWIPAAIIQGFHHFWFNMIGIIIAGIIISYIDTFIKPKLIGDKASIHPAITLLGLIGGLQLMGFVGIIIGPIVLSLLILFIRETAKGIN